MMSRLSYQNLEENTQVRQQFAQQLGIAPDKVLMICQYVKKHLENFYDISLPIKVIERFISRLHDNRQIQKAVLVS